eukprot:158065-Prorocentrum_minimum.AAC.1
METPARPYSPCPPCQVSESDPWTPAIRLMAHRGETPPPPLTDCTRSMATAPRIMLLLSRGAATAPRTNRTPSYGSSCANNGKGAFNTPDLYSYAIDPLKHVYDHANADDDDDDADV